MSVILNKNNLNLIFRIVIIFILVAIIYYIAKHGIKADEAVQPGAIYTGSVTSVDGMAVEGAIIKFEENSDHTPITISDNDGRYSVNVPKGNYHIVILTKDGQQDFESPISVTDEDIGTTQTIDFPGIVSEPFDITSDQIKNAKPISEYQDSNLNITSPTQNQTFTKTGTCPSCNVAIPVTGTVRAGGTATISKVEAFKGTQLMKTFSLPSGGLTTWDIADTIGIGNPSTSTFSLVFKATFSDNSTVSSDSISVNIN